MDLNTIRKTAAYIAVAYILVQSFQWYVFAQFPAAANAQEEMMQGHHALHVTRSWLMLISMFAMLILNITVCYIAATINRFWAIVGMAGYFTFFLLEISLRSVELFYIQLYLPQQALKADPGVLQNILDKYSTFANIQHALYFPLIFSTSITYFSLFFIFKPKVHRIIRFVMLVNILRSSWRLGSDFLNIGWLQGSLYNTVYLPLVVLLFGLTAIWLLRMKTTCISSESSRSRPRE
ncbi:MAG: hypothetical protein ACTHMC_23145 [Pseudobacter sp.]|uniref:hypothetical protein n=1 Tax=Pseudobacter sp. TaxID=2045420 RepID=UPI003F805CA0